MQNGTTQAWFYSSKGLNELFLWPRKPKLSGLKTTMQLNANPKPLPPSITSNPIRRGSKDGCEGDQGKGQKEERPLDGDHSRANNNGATNNGSGSAGRRGPIPSRGNQYGYNLSHDRGRAYGRYTRGWQRQATSTMELDSVPTQGTVEAIMPGKLCYMTTRATGT
jgi:hypothetical protein